MTERQRRIAVVASWTLGAAGCACIALFPAFAHFTGGIRWELGAFTGWTGRMAWVKSRK